MEKCPYCDSENDDGNPFCERCGTLMHVLVPYEPKEEDYVSPPHASIKFFEVQIQKHVSPEHAPTGRAVFYFVVALPVALAGMFSLFASFGSSARLMALALCCSLALTYSSIVMFHRLHRRTRRLSTSIFVIGLIAATVGSFLVFCLEIVLVPDIATGGHPQLSTRMTSAIIMCYGLTLEGLALW
jgi:zinc ribbon protein